MSTTPEALRLASVPIVDRGIGWQADATATLKQQAARIESDAAEIARLREANDRFAQRQEWWTARMFALEQERDALRAENFKLAAGQCANVVGDEGGTPQCAEIARQRKVIGQVNARCDHLGMRLGEVIAERDALRAEVAALKREPLTEWDVVDLYIQWANTPGASHADLIRMVERAHKIGGA